MGQNFFSGSYRVRLDDKNRIVLPQQYRYQLVENGELRFTIAPGGKGFLAIYKEAEIAEMVELFRKKKHIARFQSFFTLFFSTMVHTTCDKLGRVTLPAALQKSVGIQKDIMIAGAMDKIQLWPLEVYEQECLAQSQDIGALMEEILMGTESTNVQQELVLQGVDN